MENGEWRILIFLQGKVLFYKKSSRALAYVKKK